MVYGDWESRRTGQCPGSRLISQIVAVQRFLPRHPVGSGGHHLRWPLAQHGGERHRVPASESPVPEGVRQGPRGHVSPFSRGYKTTNDTSPRLRSQRRRGMHTGPHTHTHTHTRARAPVTPFTRALPGGPTRLSLLPPLTPASGHYNPLLSEDTLSHKSPGAGGRVACSTGVDIFSIF